MTQHPPGRVLAVVLATALTGAALVTSTPAATAATVPCTHTFTSGLLDEPVPDLGSVASEIDVPEDGLEVADIDVTVNLRHTAPTDLEIFLRSSTDGSTLRAANKLFNHDGGGDGSDLVGTVFDDDATTRIVDSNAPYTGRFRPSQPSTVHVGASGGRYQLLVADTLADDAGTLGNWSVTLTYETCDPDGDGVDVPKDRCTTLAAPTASGCPVASRSLRAFYRAGKFRARIGSPVARCAAAQPVTVWKVRRGADRKVGTVSTRADGSSRLARAKRRGRYYATVPRVVLPDVAECPAARSAKFRIR